MFFFIGAVTENMLKTKCFTLAFINSFLGEKCCFYNKFDNSFSKEKKKQTIDAKCMPVVRDAFSFIIFKGI